MPQRRVGIFGGSFNPPHLGHLAMATEARRRLDLSEVWMLVSPQNPLKPKKGMAPLAQRLAMCRAMAGRRRWLKPTDVESRLHTTFTYETLRALKNRHKNVEFVWLMGSDNLASFHKWEAWGRLMRLVPMAIFVRPDVPSQGLKSPAATRFAAARRPQRAPLGKAPNWRLMFVSPHHGRATDIRAALAEGRPTDGLAPEVLRQIHLTNAYAIPTSERRRNDRHPKDNAHT